MTSGRKYLTTNKKKADVKNLPFKFKKGSVKKWL